MNKDILKYFPEKIKNVIEENLADLNLEEISDAIHWAITRNDYSKVDQVLSKHRDSLKVFYLNNKN